MLVNPAYRTDHALWFFSTCAQTFAGLVSIFGMFILYRLQIEEGRVGGLRQRLTAYDPAHAGLPFESVMRLLDKHERSELLTQLLRDHTGAVAKRSWLSRAARRPIFIFAALIVWSLLALVLYPHFTRQPVFLSALLWITWIAAALAVWDSAIIIFVSIRSD